MGEITIREIEIQELYEKVMKKITGGSLYGIKINIYDIRELIVSAYLIGQLEHLGLFKEKELAKR